MKRSQQFLGTFVSSSYRLSDVASELKELLEEVAACNLDAAHEELGDFLLAAQLWVATVTGWDWRMVLPARTWVKYEDRVLVWRRIFAEHGLEFSPNYLVNGGNYNKKHKVEAALALARKKQNQA
jgi:hypothetical protein